MTKPTEPAGRLAPVQFRPGMPLARWIHDLARGWDLNENEAAKRLTALACCRLDAQTQYQLIVDLADALGRPGSDRQDFPAACEHVRNAIEGADRARQDFKKPPMNEQERHEFIERIVNEAAPSRGTRRSRRNNS
jgi:hypothetical protein